MKAKAQRIISSSISILLMAAFPACNSDTFKVGRAVSHFHTQLKASKYKDIYKEASENIRVNMTEEEFAAHLQKVQLMVGEIQSVEKRDHALNRITELSNSKLATEVHTVNGTNGRCTELTWWMIQDDKVELFGFEYRPDSL